MKVIASSPATSPHVRLPGRCVYPDVAPGNRRLKIWARRTGLSANPYFGRLSISSWARSTTCRQQPSLHSSRSLVRDGEVNDLVGDYGQLIVDECHHLSAVSFELVARRSKARYVLGLSATIARKDGHHPIIFMQCGPVRYRVDAKSQAATRPFSHKVTIRETGFRLAPELESQSSTQIGAIYAALVKDEKNDQIFDDVQRSLEAGRRPVILTERRDHLDLLHCRFRHFTKNLVVLYGGMTTADRRETEELLKKRPDTEERLVLATGRYLGEGFDDASLDTLFLTMPISWRGTLAQYVGRLHREHHAKCEVIVYDCVDLGVHSSPVWRSSARLGIAASVTKFHGKSQLRRELQEPPYGPSMLPRGEVAAALLMRNRH